jgi:hypothetical protein
MPVMSEKYDLRLASQLTKDLKPCCRVSVIEIDEEIVGDERNGVRSTKIIFD